MAVLVGDDVDAGEVTAQRADRAKRKILRRRRRAHAPAHTAESDIGAPFTR